ncbi:hypothetical protein FS749_010899 [Ceratobasidium sp. UAMH 11750]|nr:hypothetical protein FS749_010899 [Ceratobasidium sp. UAMH 11750]
MKLGDFRAWIYVDDQAQLEHRNYTAQNSFTEQGHKVRRLTRRYVLRSLERPHKAGGFKISGIIAATLGNSFQVRWVCDTKAPGYSLHYSLHFHNMKIATGVVDSPEFNEVRVIHGVFEFGKQTLTDMDELADADDDEVATIRLEFQWVRPCSKRRNTRKGCLECSKLRDQGGDSRPIRKSRRTSHSTSFSVDPNRVVPGLVHERAKKAHGISAISHTYRDLRSDLDIEDEDFQFHGTFKDQVALRFFYGPEDWLESKGWIEPQVRAPQNESDSSSGEGRLSPSSLSEQGSHRSLGPANNPPELGFGNPLATDDEKPHIQAELKPTNTTTQQVIEIDDDEDEKPLISSSPPPTSVDIKQEPSDPGGGQPGGNLASMLGLLIHEVRQGNALMRRMNEGIDRLVQTRERNTNTH